MAGFTDLLLLAQPTIANVSAAGTAGNTWRYEFVGVVDENGDPIDLTAAAGACEVLDSPGGSVLATFTVTGTLGGFLLDLDEATTAPLAASSPLRCVWRCTFTQGGDAVRFWGPSGSTFTIYPN